MMDKDTGRPRGFGFVTFDSEAAVDRCLQHVPLEIMNKPIEVKKAQPRGKMGEDDHHQQNQGRNKFGHGNFHANTNQMNQMPNMMGGNSMTPQMMAQYWQKMQQYFAMMQQQAMAANMGGMGMGGMNPQMMAQMQQMQMQNGMGGMNPQMQQQMMMQQMQNGGMGTNVSPGRQGFSAAEQQAFEQRKYEHQVNKRQYSNKNTFNTSHQQQQQQPSQAGPQSWEGMYDGEPQPDTGSNSGRGSVGPGAVRSGPGGKGGKVTPQPSNAPANAPTGPKNAGKPGANFRGGRGGRYHPYGR